ncbi:S4 domain-containing protein [Sulfuriferula nivalis]|uniref:Dual-specificity RNA pseudouridine synthase RluF n=1 Tax=Sulfuriferula nivalis TaxID=2675298 RepID=A0A809S4P7_9PROT|nr:S4 domain-containing protein [Sulfuriferula nivalis]BBP02008.1 RNA-binding protein S4 [Sulfuriferula nivalis]
MTDSIRLSKRLADMMPCSRREAEQYIEGGWVKVDGEVVEVVGYRVTPEQLVEIMPDACLTTADPVTILLHKPAGVDASAGEDNVNPLLQLISAETRAADDRSPLIFLQRHLRDLRMVMPLPINASGLLVFSQDWRIVRKLVDDADKVEQEYIVEVTGELEADGLALLNHGLSWSGRPLPAMKVSWQNERRLRFAAKAVQAGQIVGACEKVGLTVIGIKRIRIGRMPMAGLAVAQWRYLQGYERF